MENARLARRRNPRFETTRRGYACLPSAGRLLAILLLAAFAASAAAAPQTTSFVHSVGFSFDYPTKWQLKQIQEGIMLIPHNAVRDAAGQPMELVIIGFVDTAGVTDPFEPSFANAFEQRYRSIVPSLARGGDLDWLNSSLGTGLLVPYEDSRGNRHQLYCAAHDDLGIFLAHVTQRGTVRRPNGKVQQIFSSFSWTESMIDPALIRSWSRAASLATGPLAPLRGGEPEPPVETALRFDTSKRY